METKRHFYSYTEIDSWNAGTDDNEKVELHKLDIQGHTKGKMKREVSGPTILQRIELTESHKQKYC